MNSSTAEPTVGWYTGPNERGTLTLVYSCLLTTFACTWTVLHLNVPALEDSGGTRFIRKAKWMAITILLPEFIFAKAVCELRLALKNMAGLDMKIQEEYDNDLSCIVESQGYMDLKWTWRIKYGRFVLLLFSLLGLPRPDRRVSAKRRMDENGNMRRGNARKGKADQSPLKFAGGHVNRPNDGRPQADTSTGSENGDDPGPECANSNINKGQKVKSAPRDFFIQKSQDWTLTHSYFANMGGLVYQAPVSLVGVTHFVLTGSHLDRISWPPGENPLQKLVLTREDIADKSKADCVLRAMSMMQITWLMLTIFARHTSALPLTQLELATFAFSIFAVATYAVNWWKPKDVSRPTNLSGLPRILIDVDQTQSFVLRLMSPSKAREHAARPIAHVARIENDVLDLEGRLPLIFKLMAAAAFVFGGIHCLAWNFAFPSHAEAVLWKIASIGSAVIPIIQLGISILFNYLGTVAANSRLKFLVKELDHLKQFPSCYFDRLEQASFAECLRDSNLSCTIHTGTCDFINVMSQEDPAGIRQRERPSFYNAMDTIESLRQFIRVWRAIQRGDTNLHTIHQFESRFLHVGLFYTKAVDELLDYYENKHIKPHVIASKSGYTELPDITVVRYLMHITKPIFEGKRERARRAKENYELVSRFMTIICGVLYVSVRLIIIVLLFTSLREVPVEVYTETPWTRFLPRFS